MKPVLKLISGLPLQKVRLNVVIPLLFFNFLLACTHGHCPQTNRSTKDPKATKIWVYKYDQSKQCDKKPGTAIEVMLKDFKAMSVTVFESKKQYDGLMRIQACGAFTGLANVFLIQKDDLNKVISRGYQTWDF
jgi:hypothetical protein